MNERQMKCGWCVAVVILALATGCDYIASRTEKPPAVVPEQPAAPEVTFNRDIAPILYQNCTTCHRPGEAAPFNLLSYVDARDRAEQIAEVTQSRYMPPWLPVEGYGEFDNERRLTKKQIAKISQWAAAGAPEGLQQDRPDEPQFTPGWQLGVPDLLIEMPKAYTLPAEGRDVYRNFVIPLDLPRFRYVRGMEVRFDNPKVVHHAFVLFDASGNARERDLEDDVLGFEGMDVGVHTFAPPGQSVSWQPGKVPRFVEPGMTYRLDPGTDLVLQVHMQPTGKPVQLKAKVGFYFSDEAPTKFPFKVMLRRIDIDIPAGEAEYVIEDSYTMPVDAKVIAVLPHAHYLGKAVEAYTLSPTGEKIWLLKIDEWDFNWQGDYHLKRPIYLQRGSELHMRWTYDNSAANPRNPHNPPQAVSYGPRTDDEMGEFWVQVVAMSAEAQKVLHRDNSAKVVEEVVQVTTETLAAGDDFKSARRQYQALMLVGRDAEALPAAETALRLRPDSAEVNLEVGFLHFRLNQHAEAQQLLLRSIELDPQQPKPHYILGLSHLNSGEAELGKARLRQAIVLNPAYVDARNDLGRVLLAQKNFAAAVQQFQAALKLAPQRADIRANLAAAQRGG